MIYMTISSQKLLPASIPRESNRFGSGGNWGMLLQPRVSVPGQRC